MSIDSKFVLDLSSVFIWTWMFIQVMVMLYMRHKIPEGSAGKKIISVAITLNIFTIAYVVAVFIFMALNA